MNNEYTEFDTAAEMQKALDAKKAAYGVPYQSLTETCEVDERGIIVDRRTVQLARSKDGDLHTLCTYQHNTATYCEECCGADYGAAYKRLFAEERDIDPVNEILAKDERPSFAPTDGQIAAFILAFFLFLSFGINEAMKGDLRAATYTEIHGDVR